MYKSRRSLVKEKTIINYLYRKTEISEQVLKNNIKLFTLLHWLNRLFHINKFLSYKNQQKEIKLLLLFYKYI